MTELEKYLLHKHLVPIPSSIEKLGGVAHVCSFSAGGWRQEDPWPCWPACVAESVSSTFSETLSQKLK